MKPTEKRINDEIEGFDAALAKELKNRAVEYIDNQNDKININFLNQ
jgi:hypothetical protein